MSAYFRPDNLPDALDFLTRTGATVAAGCTDLFPATEAPALKGPVLDVGAIGGLRGITRTKDGWRIGAATTWTDILAADLPPAFDMLKEAAREVGSVQIQNAGTVAGNLCNASPAADGVPPLLALDARVELTSANGTRDIALDAFITGVRRTAMRTGEIVTAVTIPASAGEGVSRFLKLGARAYLVISIAMVAVRLEISGPRITQAALAVGACSPVARRLSQIEKAMRGASPDEALALLTDTAVAAALDPIADVRGSAEYRADAAAELLRRALSALTGART